MLDLETNRPVTRRSIFRISSTTKPITAACAMTLVDEGVIGLDDPVTDLLPELVRTDRARGPRRIVGRHGARRSGHHAAGPAQLPPGPRCRLHGCAATGDGTRRVAGTAGRSSTTGGLPGPGRVPAHPRIGAPRASTGCALAVPRRRGRGRRAHRSRLRHELRRRPARAGARSARDDRHEVLRAGRRPRPVRRRVLGARRRTRPLRPARRAMEHAAAVRGWRRRPGVHRRRPPRVRRDDA